MEYYPNSRFEMSHALGKHSIDSSGCWRCFHFEFVDLPENIGVESLARKIFNIFKNLDGGFYFDPRIRMSIFCKMEPTIIIDDIVYKILNLIKEDFMCRLGEQKMLNGDVLSFQFLFSPTGSAKAKLSQEFIVQERIARSNDVIMVVEDDLFARNIVVNALRSKFKVVEVSDGAKATSEYLAHSPDVVFLDIHLPNKKGHQILKEIIELDPEAYVVMLSADAAKERIVDCINVGAKGFIAKPFQGEKLFGYIRKCSTIRVYC